MTESTNYQIISDFATLTSEQTISSFDHSNRNLNTGGITLCALAAIACFSLSLFTYPLGQKNWGSIALMVSSGIFMITAIAGIITIKRKNCCSCNIIPRDTELIP